MDLLRNSGYEQALLELYRAARSEFVAERKRLALALKASGDKEAAARLAKLLRPSAAVWAVNQLWWRRQERCEQLFASAKRVRTGDATALNEHRELLSSLRQEAETLLIAAGQPGSEATLRAVSTNLSALAASGGFEPDLPGALSSDREPPGFEAMQAMVDALSAAPLRGPTQRRSVEAPATPEPAAPSEQDGLLERRKREQTPVNAAARDRRLYEARRKVELRRAEEQRQIEEQRRLAAQRAELERQQKERARRAEIRWRLGRERDIASREREGCVRRVERLRAELTSAEAQLEKARARLNDVDARLAEYSDEPSS